MAQKRNIVIKTPGVCRFRMYQKDESRDTETVGSFDQVCDTWNSDRIRRDQPDHAIRTQTVL